MKKIVDILTGITETSEFKRLSTNIVVNDIISVLPPNLKKGVKFGYIKNNTFFFVLNHPVYKMEFTYNLATLKAIINKWEPSITKVEYFISNKIPEKSKEEISIIYNERSYALFDNKAKDPKIYRAFERIRETIKNQRFQ